MDDVPRISDTIMTPEAVALPGGRGTSARDRPTTR